MKDTYSALPLGNTPYNGKHMCNRVNVTLMLRWLSVSERILRESDCIPLHKVFFFLCVVFVSYFEDFGWIFFKP